MANKIIPTTNLRKLYSFFRFLSTKTQLAILDDYNRGRNYLKLASLYNESKNYFSNYNNDEPFINDKSKRSGIASHDSTGFHNTNDVISFFINEKEVKVNNRSDLSFSYIEREIDPRRMTRAKYDDGTSGKSSGIGGIDFIAWNSEKGLPIIGEIKCRSDETPFFAFLQLLMYCAEMSTPSQLKRINDYNLFSRNIELPYLLHIFLGDFNLKGEKGKFIDPLKMLIPKVVEEISDIKDLVILDANKENKLIECI